MQENLAVTEGSDHGLSVGQAVEVARGALAGVWGVLVGFSQTQQCQIELHVAQRGVFLVIDPEAVNQFSPVAVNAPLVQADAMKGSNSNFFRST